MIKLIKAIAIIACIAMPLVFTSLAMAIDDPDSNPSVSNVKANRYLLQEGDVLIYGDYNIPYVIEEIPEVPASETFIFRLLGTDGITELGTVVPYVMFDSGYNKGCFSFYFSATDNLSWGKAYTIRISQNPAYFETPTSVDYVMPLSAYTLSSAQEANRVELAINVIGMAQRLENHYTDYTFLEASAGGTVLSSPTGETYFRGAIYGIQAIAPSLFLVQVLEQDTADRDWTTDEFDEYKGRWADTWVETDMEATSTQFGITPQMLMSVFFALPLCIGAIIVSSMKYKKAEPGFIFAAIMLLMTAMMGWMPTAIFAAIYQAMGIYLAYVWFYARG